MILRRLGSALRARDWTAVAIEFAIVVLGIFAALQAENWNQERRDRQLEQVYISRLIDETRANLVLLSELERILEDKIDFILALPDLSLDEAFRLDPQAFMYQLDFSTYLAIPALRSETYQELESSGRLSLLRDTELRSAIASNLNDYGSAQPFYAEPIGDYRRILFETLPGRPYHEYRVGAGVSDAAAVVAAVEAFRSDPRFNAAANAEITYGADLLFYIRDFKRRTEEILSLLQANGNVGTIRNVPYPFIEGPRSQDATSGSEGR
jgi:hypothetical protein